MERKYNPLRMCIETEQTGNRTTTSCSGCYFLKREKKRFMQYGLHLNFAGTDLLRKNSINIIRHLSRY
jgi:hypothetical protein